MSAKRAYRPHVPGDLNTGDVVKFRRPGGRIEVGQVHYVGHLPGKSQAFVGLETQHASQCSTLLPYFDDASRNKFSVDGQWKCFSDFFVSDIWRDNVVNGTLIMEAGVPDVAQTFPVFKIPKLPVLSAIESGSFSLVVN